MRHYFAIFVALVLLVFPWFFYNYPSESQSVLNQLRRAASQLASVVVSHDPKTVAEIRSKYDRNASGLFRSSTHKIRILIVPGHEPGYGGAEYGALKERDMNVEVAENLRDLFEGDKRYEVILTRDSISWNQVFANYFKVNKDATAAWLKAHKEDIVNMTRLGEFKPNRSAVFHNAAPDSVAMRLYGIDQWSNENDIDIMIHVHFNDYPRRNHAVPGEYSGFSIYVPEKQYDNSTTTRALAETVFRRLDKYNAVSDLPGEKTGIVEDQDLIAVGSYNSVNAASMLIEYGYIYEPQFADAVIRKKALEDLAYQTYLGIEDFLADSNVPERTSAWGTALVPYHFPENINEEEISTDVYALQTALLIEGVYPPHNKSKNECPRTGRIGSCTKAALAEFQTKHSIDDERGAGPKTLETLNEIYGR